MKRLHLRVLSNPMSLVYTFILLLAGSLMPAKAETVLVSDFANNQILSYTTSDTGAWTLNSVFIASGTYGGISLASPMGLATDGTSVYVAVSTAILRFSTSGQYLGTVATNTSANAANGLTVDSSGNLYYTVAFGSSQGLYKITNPSGTAVVSTIASGLSNPRGVAIGSNGHIYVTQRGAGTITEYAADGSLVGTLISGLGTVQAVAWDDTNSRLLVSYGTDLTHTSIGAISTTGVLTQLYNNSGATYFFNNSLGVIEVNGQVYASSIQSNDISRINSLTSASDVVTGIDAGYMLALVPEPSSLSLLLLAGGWVILRSRRKSLSFS